MTKNASWCSAAVFYNDKSGCKSQISLEFGSWIYKKNNICKSGTLWQVHLRTMGLMLRSRAVGLLFDKYMILVSFNHVIISIFKEMKYYKIFSTWPSFHPITICFTSCIIIILSDVLNRFKYFICSKWQHIFYQQLRETETKKIFDWWTFR